MTKQEHIDYWINTAISDLDVADTLFIAKKNLWCLFIGHLVIEKVLKAYFVFILDETPPKIHNLLTLSEKTGLELNNEQLAFLDNLNLFQISARYPDYKQKMYNLATDEFTKDFYQYLKDFFEWVRFQMI